MVGMMMLVDGYSLGSFWLTYNSQIEEIVIAKIIISMLYQLPMRKHYQCLHSHTTPATTMASPNNQAETTLDNDDSIATLPSASNTNHPKYRAQMEESFDSPTMTQNEW